MMPRSALRFAWLYTTRLTTLGCLAGAISIMVGPNSLRAAEVMVAIGSHEVPVDYALGKLEALLVAHGDSLVRQDSESSSDALVVRPPTSELGADGFKLERVGKALVVTGGDSRGTMYGLLDVVEQIQLGTPLSEILPRTVHARFQLRAIKFNLPWAAYRNGPYLEQHQETCRDLKFWEAFLDMMAANRFNTLTLWSLHPFHYMVVPKSFPEAQTFSDVEMAEWHTFWTALFKMAKERGIETYLVNWNIFVSPAFSKAHDIATYSQDWKHVGDGPKDKIVEDYMRECVTQVIDEYPDLTGLGTTLGERMGGQTPDERRDWLEKTFYDGIAAAKRPVKLLYRAPLSAGTSSGGSTSVENDRLTRVQVETQTRNLTLPVYVDFKYNASHAQSSPDLFIVHGGKMSDAYATPPPTGYKITWTMRNEDFFILRWGQPDFVRQFEQSNLADYIGGVIVGSENYIPALDFITAAGPHKTWHYAFERQWLFYAVWGHLLYEPELPDARFAAMLESRFGPGTGNDLLQAWKLASQVPLRFASFYQGTWDGALYTEGFSTWADYGARKLIDINSFITHPVLDTKRYINIADYVKAGGQVAPGIISPPALAAQLERDCAEAVKLVAGIRTRNQVSPTLDCELTDIEAWCAYGDYFAKKLRAGVALATARANNDAAEQEKAVKTLELAVDDWQRLSALGAKFNQLPILSSAKEPFSWASLTPEVKRDIELANAPLTTRAARTTATGRTP